MKTTLFVAVLAAILGAAQATPGWQGETSVFDSLGNVHPRNRPRWLHERGVELRALFEPSEPDSGSLRLVGKWGRGPSFQVTGVDTLVFLSLGSQVAILSFANPGGPRVISEVQAAGIVTRAAVRDSMLYIGVSTGMPGLEAWNIQNPALPVFRGRVLTRLNDFCLKDSLALVTQRSYPSRDTFKVYDLSDPEAIGLVGVRPDSGTTVAVAGSTVLLGDDRSLHALDISDPTRPLRVGSYPGWAMSVAARNTIACVTFGNPNQPGDLTFRVLDISDPAAMVPLATLSNTGGSDIFLEDTLAFLSGHYSGPNEFRILSIADSTRPRLLGSAVTPGWGMGTWANRVAGRAYIANHWEGLLPMDISNLANPVPDSAVLGAHEALDVHVDDMKMYIAGYGSGLHIVDVTNPSRPTTLGRFDTTGMMLPTMRAAVARDSFAYVGWQFPRFRTVNVADPRNPEGTGACAIFNSPQDMVLVDSFVYIAQVARFQVVNVARPREPVLVGSCVTQEDAEGLCVVDTLAYVANYPFVIISVAEPTLPTIVGTIARGAWNGTVRDTFLFLSSGGVLVYSVADPTRPRLIDSTSLGPNTFWVEAVGSLLYTGNRDGVHVVDASDVHNMREVGFASTPYAVKRLHYASPYIYAACWDAGVAIFESTQVAVAEPTGSGRAVEQPFRIEPNPAGSRVRLSGLSSRQAQVTVRDVSGRLVVTFGLDRHTDAVIDVTGLPSGLYFIEARTGNGRRTAKFVKR